MPSSTVTATATPVAPPLAGLGADHGYAGAPFEQRKQSWIRRKLSAAGAAILALLAKLKAILLLLPKFKLLATAGTMIVSIIAYGSIWGFSMSTVPSPTPNRSPTPWRGFLSPAVIRITPAGESSAK